MGHYGKQEEPYLPLFRQADLNKQLRPRSDATFCGVWTGSKLFVQVCLSEYLV